MKLPTFDDVAAAHERIRDRVVRTPMLRSSRLDSDASASIFLKPETLQVGGSFKFRGAVNRILQLTDSERRRGVVAWSSGNHAQGVAAAASLLGVKATIVMPADAPKLKIENTKRLGGDVVFYDRKSENRERIAFDISAKTGAIVVPSFDDPDIIAGQGTAAIELIEDVRTAGEPLDAFLVCCGGGGLAAGCALAFEALSPETRLYTVEPEGYDDHARSFVTGQREQADTRVPSICDALLAPQPGELTFAVNRERFTGGIVVSEAEVRRAVMYAFEVLKLTVEPGGSVALAAVLAGKMPGAPERVGVMVSGGNVDPALFSAILSA